jgi:hypothetical protein
MIKKSLDLLFIPLSINHSGSWETGFGTIFMDSFSEESGTAKSNLSELFQVSWIFLEGNTLRSTSSSSCSIMLPVLIVKESSQSSTSSNDRLLPLKPLQWIWYLFLNLSSQPFQALNDMSGFGWFYVWSWSPVTGKFLALAWQNQSETLGWNNNREPFHLGMWIRYLALFLEISLIDLPMWYLNRDKSSPTRKKVRSLILSNYIRTADSAEIFILCSLYFLLWLMQQSVVCLWSLNLVEEEATILLLNVSWYSCRETYIYFREDVTTVAMATKHPRPLSQSILGPPNILLLDGTRQI